MNTSIFVDNSYFVYPDRIALSCDDTHLTYRELYNQITYVSNSLRQLGCKKGSRVAIVDKNRIESIVLYYALSRIGAVFIPLNPRFSAGELFEMIDIARPTMIFLGNSNIELIPALKKRFSFLKHIITLDKRSIGVLNYSDLLTGDDTYFVEDVDISDINVILFTSGTTRTPKAVCISQHCFLNYIRTKYKPNPETNDISLLAAPQFHIISMLAIMGPFYRGQRLVVMRHFVPESWLHIVESERITRTILSSSMFSRIINCPFLEKADLSSLTEVGYGGDYTPPAVIMEAIRKLPPTVRLLNYYNLTETVTDVSALSPEDHRIDESDPGHLEKIIRLNSIGRALPGIEWIIANRKEKELPRGTIGEVLIHTPYSFLGYLDPVTHELVPYNNYWIHSCDMGYMDEDGYVFLVGQKMSEFLGIETPIDKPERNVDIYPCTFWDVADSTTERTDFSSFRNVNLQTIIHAFNELYKCLDIDELRKKYLSIVTQLIDASAYGISLKNIDNDSSEAEDEDDQLVRWKLPPYDEIPINIISTDLTDPYYPSNERAEINRYVSLKKFVKDIKPNHIYCLPLYSSSHELLGVITFARVGANWIFTQEELGVMRLLANHMCVTIQNAYKHTRLKKEYKLMESIIEVTGYAVFVTDNVPSIHYMNQFARRFISKQIISGSAQIAEIIKNNIRQLKKTGRSEISRSVILPTTEGDKQYYFKTILTGEENLPFVSICYESMQSPKLDFMSSILSSRELDILSLIMEGVSNTDISEKLFISVNTVKYHIKNIFLKMGVSSKAELISKVYCSLNEKTPIYLIK